VVKAWRRREARIRPVGATSRSPLFPRTHRRVAQFDLANWSRERHPGRGSDRACVPPAGSRWGGTARVRAPGERAALCSSAGSRDTGKPGRRVSCMCGSRVGRICCPNNRKVCRPLLSPDGANQRAARHVYAQHEPGMFRCVRPTVANPPRPRTGRWCPAAWHFAKLSNGPPITWLSGLNVQPVMSHHVNNDEGHLGLRGVAGSAPAPYNRGDVLLGQI
jgi:hypothetical protein